MGWVGCACTSESHLVTTFSDLGLAEPLLKALADEGYQTPTPIQAQAIPSLLTGRDLLGIAQTGTGKTAAFALPILHRLAANPKPAPRRGARVLVLSPTRELASQIAESFETYGRHLKLRVAVIFGGVSYRPQLDALNRGLDVLVATPGRLIDHMNERNADLRSTEVLVLDEADQMLDLGFIKPIRQIVATLPAERQNLLFSATMPKEISGLADQLLKNPVKVAVTPVSSTVERVSQRVIHVEQNKKRAVLAELLRDEAVRLALVFTRTKRGADRVAQHLDACGVSSAAIHGNKSQRQREIALDDFKEGRIRVLVATDIAARGIDVSSVSHVVNFELPEVPEVYVHRIGRTGRAGASGEAISLCAGEERDLLRAIERITRQTLPAEDRRRDTSLEADKTPDRSSGDRGDRGRQGRSDRGARRPDAPRSRSERPTAERADRNARPARPSGPSDHRDRNRQDDRRPERRDERRGQGSAGASGGGVSSGGGTGADLAHMRFFGGASSQKSEAGRGGRSEGERAQGGSQSGGFRSRRRGKRGGQQSGAPRTATVTG